MGKPAQPRLRESRTHTLAAPPLAVALSLLLLIVAAPASQAVAASGPFDLQLETGYNGVAHTRQWIPVTITIQNGGGDFRGTLAVSTGAGLLTPVGGIAAAQPAGARAFVSGTFTTYRLPVSLPATGRKRFTAYVLAGGEPLRVELLDTGGRLMAAAATRVRIDDQNPLVAVISDSDATLDLLDRLPVGGTRERIQVTHFKPAAVPLSAILLRAFDVVAIDDAATDQFTPSQQAALLDYVEMGGALLVAGGVSWRKTTAGLPSDLLPVNLRETHAFGDLPRLRARLGAPPLEHPVELSVGERRAGLSVVAEDSTPLIVEAARGQGRVLFTAMDFAAEPMATWPGTPALLRQVIARLVLVQPGASGASGFTFGRPSAGIEQHGQAIGSVLANIPALDLPSLPLIGLLLLAYVLMVGPLNYLLLRRWRRRDLAWVSIPLITLFFALTAYGVGLRAKGQEVLANRVQLVHLEDGWSHAYVESYAGIFVPHRGTYQVRVEGQPFVIGLGNGTFGDGSPEAALLTVDVKPAVELQLANLNAWSMRGFGMEEVGAAPGTLDQHLRVIDGRIFGTITSHLPFALTDAVIVTPASYQAFGPIAPGGTITVDVAVAGPGATTAAIVQRIYPFLPELQKATALKSGPLPSPARDTQRRYQILQAIAPAGIETPLFVAWTTAHLHPLQVNGRQADVRDLDALLLRLRPVDPPAAPLAEGAIPPRLVDLSGEPLNGLGRGLSLGPRGTATFELTLPGAVWHDLHLRLARSLAQRGGSQGQPINAAALSVYNYASGGWDRLPLKTVGNVDEAVLESPAPYLSPEGLLQVYLQALAPRGTVLGPLTLTAQPGVAA